MSFRPCSSTNKVHYHDVFCGCRTTSRCISTARMHRENNAVPCPCDKCLQRNVLLRIPNINMPSLTCQCSWNILIHHGSTCLGSTLLANNRVTLPDNDNGNDNDNVMLIFIVKKLLCQTTVQYHYRCEGYGLSFDVTFDRQCVQGTHPSMDHVA